MLLSSLVSHSRLADLERSCAGQHLALRQEAVPHNPSTALSVDYMLVSYHELLDLHFQSLLEHSLRSLACQIIEHASGLARRFVLRYTSRQGVSFLPTGGFWLLKFTRRIRRLHVRREHKIRLYLPSRAEAPMSEPFAAPSRESRRALFAVG